jgi:hypothetical protein
MRSQDSIVSVVTRLWARCSRVQILVWVLGVEHLVHAVDHSSPFIAQRLRITAAVPQGLLCASLFCIWSLCGGGNSQLPVLYVLKHKTVTVPVNVSPSYSCHKPLIL